MGKLKTILLLMLVISILHATWMQGFAVSAKESATMEPLTARSNSNDSYKEINQLDKAETLRYDGERGLTFSALLLSIYAAQPPGAEQAENYAVAMKKASVYEEPGGKVTKDAAVAGIIYEKLDEQGAWSFIRGTKQLAEDPKHIAGWVRTDNLCDLKTAYSDNSILFRTVYTKNNLKLTNLPGKTKRGSTIYKGTKLRQWGTYHEYSYVTLWTDSGSSSGFVKTESLSEAPIFNASNGETYYTKFNNVMLRIGPGKSYPSIVYDSQTYPHAKEYEQKGAPIVIIGKSGAWLKFVMEDGSIGYVYCKSVQKRLTSSEG